MLKYLDLGRVGLYARTSDGKNTAMYSKTEGVNG